MQGIVNEEICEDDEDNDDYLTNKVPTISDESNGIVNDNVSMMLTDETKETDDTDDTGWEVVVKSRRGKRK